MNKARKNKHSSEEVFVKVAELLNEQMEEMNNKYIEKVEIIDEIFPMLEQDQGFLEYARACDKSMKNEKRQKRRRRFLQAAAVFLLCFTVTTTIGLETSEAFRVRIYSLLNNESNQSVALVLERETDLIGDWEEYWYPSYIPEGFQLADAEKGEDDKSLLFCDDSRESEFCIMEMSLDAIIEMDTETNECEEITVGVYRGYLFEDDENRNIKMMWITDECQIMIFASGEIEKDTVIEVAKRLEYRKERIK